MQRAFLMSFIIATLVGASPAAAESERDLLWDSAFQAQRSGVCNVHHVRMERKLVPIRWRKQLSSETYLSAMLREFPNAQDYEDADELMIPRLEHVKRGRYLCRQCQRAAKDWARAHHDNQDAKWILSDKKDLTRK